MRQGYCPPECLNELAYSRNDVAAGWGNQGCRPDQERSNRAMHEPGQVCSWTLPGSSLAQLRGCMKGHKRSNSLRIKAECKVLLKRLVQSNPGMKGSPGRSSAHDYWSIWLLRDDQRWVVIYHQEALQVIHCKLLPDNEVDHKGFATVKLSELKTDAISWIQLTLEQFGLRAKPLGQDA